MNYFQAKSVLANICFENVDILATVMLLPFLKTQNDQGFEYQMSNQYLKVRRSFVEELDLNASEVEIILDYFVYGRQFFQPDEVAFIEGSKP